MDGDKSLRGQGALPEGIGVVDEDPRMRELFEEFKSIIGSEGGEAEKRLYYRMI